MKAADVVIVGAGFAGLSATHALRAGGASIAMFEAQDRAGGRVDSVRHDDGSVYECGGQFFCRSMTNLMGLLTRYGLTHREVRHDSGMGGNPTAGCCGFGDDAVRRRGDMGAPDGGAVVPHHP